MNNLYVSEEIGMRAYESEGQMIIERSSFDKLIGTTLGNYQLSQIIEESIWGPVFLAHSETAATPYLIRCLTRLSSSEVKHHDDYLERFQNQASQLATLQHPYILPLVDYGVYRGIPYLVSPHIPMRSLRTRLTKSGPMDVLTVGRYLDQIAATLEYAHRHSVLHGGLSVDSIFIRLDGQLVVADFGVIGLLELNRQDVPKELLYGKGEVCTPEQLLGRPIGPSTDVYALGMVLYHLLTGFPVFSGNTFEEIAKQHFYAAVPPLSQGHSNLQLPAGLYSIIARALAKDTAQRYRQPGALANAYHRIVVPNVRSRVPFVITSSPTMQTQSLLTEPLTEIQVTELEERNNGPTSIDHTYEPEHSVPQTPLPPSAPFSQKSNAPHQDDDHGPSFPGRFPPKNARRAVRTAMIVVLLMLLIVASSMIGITQLSKQSHPTPGPTGQVMFFDGQNGPTGQTTALNIMIHGLNAPPAGFQYGAWLINDQSEEVLALGSLMGKNQSFSLNYSGKGSGGHTLLDTGERLEITLEQGTVKAPVGQVVLVATFPPKAFSHIQHLLVSFPKTPGHIGVLVGVLEQTRLLNIQADVLQNLAANHNAVAIRCAAQSIIDVIEGTQGLHYRPLTAPCAAQNVTMAGDGFGLLGNGYVADSAEHGTLAISQPDATSMMRSHAGLMVIALSNIKEWVTTIEQDAFHLRDNPTDLTKVQEIVTLADDAYHGVDMNGDGQIDPVAGEGGAITAYQQGQLMVTLSFTASV